MKHSLAAVSASLALLVPIVMPPTPPDTCSLVIIGQLLPAGGWSAACDGYCINSTCMVEVLTDATGTVEYSCLCRGFGGDGGTFERPTSGTPCRGVFQVKANGQPLAVICQSDACQQTCDPARALPAPGATVAACSCP
jgi:hypothetical protein